LEIYPQQSVEGELKLLILSDMRKLRVRIDFIGELATSRKSRS